MLKYENIVLGELQTNCYLVWEEKSKVAAIIDPADDGVEISERIQALKLKPVAILATHGHFDHLLGGIDLKLIYQIPFYCHSKDKFLLDRQQETASHFLGRKIKVPNFKEIDVDLSTIKEVALDEDRLEVIETPGHTPGGVCFYNKASGLLFTGDTLFAHGLRGDSKRSYSSTKAIFESIHKLLELPEDTVILSGHGEETTIGTTRMFFIK